MADYKKNTLGYEDISFDTAGTDVTFARETSTGGSQNITKVNASQIPLLLATRTLDLYNSGAMSADDINQAITEICASLASVHKFTNEATLDDIVSAGSGAVISTLERLKLNSILDVGSGTIISNEERSKLAAIASLTDEQISILNNLESVGAPLGSILIWPTSTIPTNYLECNGAALSRAQYSDLYGIIGTRYGVGDGSSTFNIPDLRGEFIRGWDHGAGNDLGSASRTDRGDGTTGDNVGTKQAEEVGPHAHPLQQRTVKENSGTGSAAGTGTGAWTTGDSTGSENRPRNVNMVYCIRYQNG